MSVVINSEIIRAVQGSVTRPAVQKALQHALSQDRPNLRLVRQLCALDLALEVEQTVLLEIDDRARNLNNPARLASAYKDLRCLLKEDDDEVSADGWNDLLSEACDIQELPPGQPTLDVIDGGSGSELSDVALPTVEDSVVVSVTMAEEGEGIRSCHTKAYPRTLRKAVVAELMAGRRSKAGIARDNGISLATVNRWYKMHILDAKSV